MIKHEGVPRDGELRIYVISRQLKRLLSTREKRAKLIENPRLLFWIAVVSAPTPMLTPSMLWITLNRWERAAYPYSACSHKLSAVFNFRCA